MQTAPHVIDKRGDTMASTFSWLDQSDQQRRKVLDMLVMFKERETVDELGLGTIRDAFADILFPGTSAPQTRARYFLFVPWMDSVANNGAIGGAMSYVVTEAFMMAVGIRAIAPSTFRGASLRRVVKILIVGCVMVAVTWPLRERMLLVPVTIGALVYVAGVWALNILTPDERQLLQKMLARVRRESRSPQGEHIETTSVNSVEGEAER